VSVEFGLQFWLHCRRFAPRKNNGLWVEVVKGLKFAGFVWSGRLTHGILSLHDDATHIEETLHELKFEASDRSPQTQDLVFSGFHLFFCFAC
jgi:hypothetical protein